MHEVHELWQEIFPIFPPHFANAPSRQKKKEAAELGKVLSNDLLLKFVDTLSSIVIG